MEYDITIIGAGVIGLSIAAALANTGLRIACIDAKPIQLETNIDDYDLRVFAITRKSQLFFEKLNIWDALVKQRISPYRYMEVWDGSGSGRIFFDCQDIGESDLGHIIENRVIVNALLSHISQHDNIKLFAPIALKTMKYENKLWHIITSDEKTITSKLLIGADGANSWVRQQAGINVQSWDYGHHALVATVTTEKLHDLTARQRFMPLGPLAFLPLENPHQCSIVWSTQPEHVAELKTLSDEQFCVQLTEAFAHRLGNVTATSQRVSFPLQMRHAKQYIKPGLVLAGDALHTIHPLAGQGVNLGLQDVMALSEVIYTALEKQHPLGALTTLRRYERARKGANITMIAAMEGFKQLFGNNNPVLRAARNLGLNLSDSIMPLKCQFIRQAMGE